MSVKIYMNRSLFLCHPYPPSPSQPSPYTRARDLPRVTPEPFVKSAATIEINALCRFIFIDFNCAFRYFGYL